MKRAGCAQPAALAVAEQGGGRSWIETGAAYLLAEGADLQARHHDADYEPESRERAERSMDGWLVHNAASFGARRADPTQVDYMRIVQTESASRPREATDSLHLWMTFPQAWLDSGT